MSKYGKELVEIGRRLGKAQSAKLGLKEEIENVRTDIARRKLDMTPQEGVWPGANAEARKTSQDKAYANDSALLEMGKRLSALEANLRELDSAIVADEETRRGLEFGVRDRLASVLVGYDDEADVVQNHEQVDPLAKAVLEDGNEALGLPPKGPAALNPSENGMSPETSPLRQDPPPTSPDLPHSKPWSQGNPLEKKPGRYSPPGGGAGRPTMVKADPDPGLKPTGLDEGTILDQLGFDK